VIISGAIIGIIISITYLFKIWLPTNIDKISLAIIGIIPVMIILFSILGVFIEGC